MSGEWGKFAGKAVTVLAAAAFGIPLLGEAVSLLDEARERWKRGTTSAEQDLGRSVDVIAEALQNEFRERDAETLAAARVEVLQLLETCPPDLRQLAAGNFDAERAAAELVEKASWDEQTRTEIEPTVRRILVIVLENFPKHPQRIPEALLAGIVELLRRSAELPGELRRELEKLQDVLAPSAILSRDPALAGFGLDVAPAGFRNAAKAFLREYLGTPEEPVPFGGRGAVLDRMWEWLDDPEAPSRALLVAPAGRGKSALVARLVADLARAQMEGLVFLPVSIRFGSNAEADFWQALAAAVFKRLGEDLAVPRADPVAHYRGFAIDRVSALTESGKPAILVIDGLDEAAGWALPPKLLPPDLPARFRILVAARVQAGDRDDTDGWQQRLGWERAEVQRFDLPPLDAQGIGEVLRSMGDPLAGLATDVDIPQELLRLTEGEPLLIRWYVEDLQARGEEAARLRPEQLQEIEPSYRGYFQRWFAEEERRRREGPQSLDRALLDQILALLAVAKGPLRSADLAELVRVLRDDPGFLLSNDALAPLARFVLGDGREQGYVLQHPKLGEYLRAEHFEDPAFIRAARRAFVEWMRKTVHALNAGELPPEECPRYLLLHGSLHLEEEDAPPEDFAALVENGWRLAHEKAEGGPHGFARDVKVVLKRLQYVESSTDGLNLRNLLLQTRCALVLSSIGSRGLAASPDLLTLAVEVGLLSAQRALELVGLRVEAPNTDRLMARVKMSAFLSEEERRQALSGLLDECRAEQDSQRAAALLAELSLQLSGNESERVAENAIARALELPDDSGRTSTLIQVARILGSGEQRRQALSLAQTRLERVEEGAQRVALLLSLASLLDAPDVEVLLEEAEKHLLSISDRTERANRISASLQYLRPDDGLTRKLVREALACWSEDRARSVRRDPPFPTPPQEREFLRLLNVGSALASGVRLHAFAARAASDPQTREKHASAAVRLASEPPLVYGKLKCWQEIARFCPASVLERHVDHVKALIRSLPDCESRMQQFEAFAPHLAGARRREFIENALSESMRIEDGDAIESLKLDLASLSGESVRRSVIEDLGGERALYASYSRIAEEVRAVLMERFEPLRAFEMLIASMCARQSCDLSDAVAVCCLWPELDGVSQNVLLQTCLKYISNSIAQEFTLIRLAHVIPMPAKRALLLLSIIRAKRSQHGPTSDWLIELAGQLSGERKHKVLGLAVRKMLARPGLTRHSAPLLAKSICLGDRSNVADLWFDCLVGLLVQEKDDEERGLGLKSSLFHLTRIYGQELNRLVEDTAAKMRSSVHSVQLLLFAARHADAHHAQVLTQRAFEQVSNIESPAERLSALRAIINEASNEAKQRAMWQELLAVAARVPRRNAYEAIVLLVRLLPPEERDALVPPLLEQIEEITAWYP